MSSHIILAIVTNYPQYHMKMWHGTLIFYSIIAVAVLINTSFARVFSAFEAIAFVVHIIGFFIVLLVLIYLSPKSDTSEVFGKFIDGGGFSSNALSAIIGAVPTMYAFNGRVYCQSRNLRPSLIFLGVAGATHMGERTMPPNQPPC